MKPKDINLDTFIEYTSFSIGYVSYLTKESLILKDVKHTLFNT